MYRKLIVERLDPVFRNAIRIVDSKLPVPGPTEVLVKLHYAGVNASDVNFSAGRYLPGASLPLDPGFEGVGIIEACGSEALARGFVRGSAVAVSKYGCFAEYILVDLEHKPTGNAPHATLYPVKSATPEVVALLVAGLTSSIGLEVSGEMKSGETVLVTGAAGGTGAFAVQLAVLSGNRVIGTCGSADKVEMLKALGCERAINYNSENVEKVLKEEYPFGIDLIFEGVGGEMLETCKRCIEPVKGRLVAMGYTSQYTKENSAVTEDAMLVRSRGGGQVRGFLLSHYGHFIGQHLEKLQELVEQNKLKSVCDPTEFKGLEMVADAVEHLHARKNTGKVLVTFDRTTRSTDGGIGPLSAQLFDCVEVFGLESDSGKLLNGQKGVVLNFFEDKGRYEIRFVPDKLVNLKPDNIRRLDDKEKLLSLQADVLNVLGSTVVADQLNALRTTCANRLQFEAARNEPLGISLTPVYERHGVDWAWFYNKSKTGGESAEEVAKNHEKIEEFIAFGFLGPSALEKGGCVEVFGLESETGKLLNGQKGTVTKYVEEKGRYEVCLGPDKLSTLKPNNIKKLSDLERVTSILDQQREALQKPQAQQDINKLREQASHSISFHKGMAKLLPNFFDPILQRHGMEPGLLSHLIETLEAENASITEAKKELETLMSFGTVGPAGFEKGTFYEVTGLTSEAGQKMNGMAVLIRGWDEAKGRYDVSPQDNLDEKKALKQDNLKLIAEKQFGSLDEATSFITALNEAYSSPAAQELLFSLKRKYKAPNEYVASLRSALLPIQQPVLEKFGFRPDFVGQNHFQKSLGVYEASNPTFLERTLAIEKALGLPKR